MYIELTHDDGTPMYRVTRTDMRVIKAGEKV